VPAVERAPFDAIVTDLRMPGIGGLTGLRRFKAKVPEIPVILVTAFATVETAIEAMKAGAFDYLTKPFEPEELKSRLTAAWRIVEVVPPKEWSMPRVPGYDVKKLLDILNSLVDLGNTVVVIEHNLDVIKTADWVIDLGPEGGDGGGLVVAEGTPEQLARAGGSFTGRYLKRVLARGRKAA
jgi:DNA-binding response OmpR family regulator